MSCWASVENENVDIGAEWDSSRWSGFHLVLVPLGAQSLIHVMSYSLCHGFLVEGVSGIASQ